MMPDNTELILRLHRAQGQLPKIPTVLEMAMLLQDAIDAIEELGRELTEVYQRELKARKPYDPHKGVGTRSVWPLTAPKE